VAIIVDRQLNRAAILIVIKADESVLKPLVILLRKSIETGFYKMGYTRDQTISVRRKTGFINSALFEV
jgi:hypothetical protein